MTTLTAPTDHHRRRAYGLTRRRRSTRSASSSTPSATASVADRGQADVDYMRRVIKVQRALAVSGRASLFLGLPAAVLAGYGAGALGIAKILDNMEIGHNVMHGQYDWTRDPALSSQTFDWDTVCPGDQWRHSHNYLHHTFTNVVGKDRDIGYGVLRMSEGKPWSRCDLLNPIKATGCSPALRPRRDAPRRRGRADHGRRSKTWAQQWPVAARRAEEVGQARRQGLRAVAAAHRSAVPSHAGRQRRGQPDAQRVVVLDHLLRALPRGHPRVHHRRVRERVDGATGTSARCSARRTSAAAGCSTSCRGNLSHQIEHHLFPDLPANRYAEIAPEVEALCERYGLPYNSRRLSRQFGSVVAKIVRLALPDRRRGESVAAAGPTVSPLPLAA